ncbi:3'-phosphoadenosine 5'-phosphosulfate sulfotransferase (PAPS reductase)/FAD synthetase-related enzyme [Thermoplasmatales archaeon BRNA1]|nr:3'-phosphoadenosine 5'-phosphosulfate sulfotransferase (PAPS reductase)/FAD synthetase-related enzyme [Thermoplasmatales archaeon BRNA1]
MAVTKLGKNHLRWCSACNLPVMEKKECPVCGGETFETPLTPPADSRPAFDFDIAKIRDMADRTFGPGCGLALIPEGHIAIMNKCPSVDRMEEVFCDGAVVTTMRFDMGAGWRFIIRTQGAFRIRDAMSRGRVFLDPSAVKFVQENKNLMAPGVVDADESIRPDDEVIMMLADHTVIGTGTAKMSGKEMKESDHGMAVKTRWHKPEEQISSDIAHTWDDVVEANKAVIEARRDEAVGFVKNTVAKYDLPAVVSFSGGKDSLATMLVTMDAGLNLRPMFLNTGLELDETVQYVHDFAKRHDLALLEEDAPNDAFFGNLVYFGPPAKDYRWCCKTNKLGPTVHMISSNFPDGVLSFIGQRKYESEARNAKPRIWQNPWTPGQIGASPIQNWSAMHVWLYIFYKKEPYNVWYARGLDRIGCFMCPASDMADLDTVSHASARYPKWDEYLTKYMQDHGLPSEWKDYGLWRWKTVPKSAKDEILRVTGKEVPPMKMTNKDESDDGPVAIRVQDGYSPCTMGYSLEAALSRPIDLKKLEPFTHALGWVIKLDEENDALYANYVTFYGAGSITVKAYTERDAQRQMGEASQLIARAFNCVGCGLCAARCQKDGGKCMYMEDGKVKINGDDCIFCRKCYGPCPAVDFAPMNKGEQKEFEQ